MDEGIDVAIRIGELPDSTMQAIRVAQVRRLICAAPEYLEQHGTPQTPDDLQRHTIVASNSSSTSPEWRLLDRGEPVSVRLQPRMTTTTNDAAMMAAVKGFGLTRLLSYQVAEHLKAGRLKAVLADFEPAPLPVHLVHREGRQASQRVRAFLDLAMERLRADPRLH